MTVDYVAPVSITPNGVESACMTASMHLWNLSSRQESVHSPPRRRPASPTFDTQQTTVCYLARRPEVCRKSYCARPSCRCEFRCARTAAVSIYRMPSRSRATRSGVSNNSPAHSEAHLHTQRSLLEVLTSRCRAHVQAKCELHRPGSVPHREPSLPAPR